METVCWADNESDILAIAPSCETDNNNTTIILYYLKYSLIHTKHLHVPSKQAATHLWNKYSTFLHDGMEPSQHKECLRTRNTAGLAHVLRTPSLKRS